MPVTTSPTPIAITKTNKLGKLVTASLITGLDNAQNLVIVPEPSTLALACLGITGLLACRRKFKK